MQLNKVTSAWHEATSILKTSSLLSWQRGGGWRQSSAVKYSRRWQSETRTWPLNLASLFSSPARSILAASSARHSQGSWQSRRAPKPTCTCIPCKSASSRSRNVNHVSVTLLSESVWRKRNNCSGDTTTMMQQQKSFLYLGRFHWHAWFEPWLLQLRALTPPALMQRPCIKSGFACNPATWDDKNTIGTQISRLVAESNSCSEF